MRFLTNSERACANLCCSAVIFGRTSSRVKSTGLSCIRVILGCVDDPAIRTMSSFWEGFVGQSDGGAVRWSQRMHRDRLESSFLKQSERTGAGSG